MKLKPSNQLELFIHGNELKNLISLYQEDKLPNKILLKGQKGIGKSTLAYHLINFVLSKDEDFPYDIDHSKIDQKNRSFKLINNGSSPNFLLIDTQADKKNINIDQIRNIIQNLNKSSLNNKPKFVLIDNSDQLNNNSINALLKVIEEPNDNIYFILIQNQKTLLSTLTSRFIKFKINLTNKESIFVINKLINEDIHDSVNGDFINYYFSPGNMYKMLDFCDENNIDLKNIGLKDFTNVLIQNNHIKKQTDIKYIFYEIIECLLKRNSLLLNMDYYNYFVKKLEKINKFNLDEESFFIELNDKILNG